MNAAALLKIAEYAGTALGVIAFALVTYWRLREKRLAKEHGLEANPERCTQHELRLGYIEERIEREFEENRQAHEKMLDQIGVLRVEIARLSRNGNGGK